MCAHVGCLVVSAFSRTIRSSNTEYSRIGRKSFFKGAIAVCTVLSMAFLND